jgi:acylphosphatase
VSYNLCVSGRVYGILFREFNEGELFEKKAS